ncbi:hypothetical protein [Winogradskyella sp. A2]|uniref:hypothetical protein n=1 Tax=Winogradskyella sp. A2 TaxID=3366944 RepID=UPI00398C55B6
MKLLLKILLLGLICSNMSLAQKNHLFVLKFEGEPNIIHNDTTQIVTNGSVIKKKSKLVMHRDDVAVLINNKGDVFELYQTGTFKHKDLLKLSPKKNNNSFSRNLINYYWKEFTNTMNKGYSKSGFVYRGDYVNLLQPLDSTTLHSGEIKFEWTAIENKTKPYYFILREKDAEKVTKIGTHDTAISLFIDDINLSYGKSYEWTVVESKYENLDKLDYSTFNLLSKSAYQSKQEELATLSDFLKSLGYKPEEIKTMLCADYKTCLN